MIYDFSQVGADTDNRIKNGILPGAAIRVNLNGKIAYEYIGGFSDIENRKLLDSENLYRLASMTKPITACAALKAEEEKKLLITDKISRYYPKFKNMYVGSFNKRGKVISKIKAFREITIEDILTHCSGLGSGEIGNNDSLKHGYGYGKSLQENIKNYSKMHLDFSPGEKQMYSPTIAFDVVAGIIEKVFDMPYEECLKKYLLNPLEMTDTAYTLSEEQAKRVVTMYRLRDDCSGMDRVEFGYKKGFDCFEAGYTSGSAGLFSGINDYCNFAEMLVNPKFNSLK